MADMAGTLPANEVEQSAVQAWFVANGIRACQHGLCYKSQGRYRALVPSDATDKQIASALRKHAWEKCRRRKEKYEGLPWLAGGVGGVVKKLISGVSHGSWCSVGAEETVLYCCGCKGAQPMPWNNFKDHIRAKRNIGKCRWSVAGKTFKEKIELEARAHVACRVRCVRASCGHWIIRSCDIPDLSRLPQLIKGAVASALKEHQSLDAPAMISSGAGIPTALVDSGAHSFDAYARGDQEDDASEHVPEDEPEIAGEAAEADIEGETNPADFGTSPPKPTILLFGYHHRKEENEANLSYDDLLREARSCKAELPGAIRDKARIVRVRELGFDTFSVSIGNMGENDEQHHYYGDFCTRSIVSELKAELKRCGKLSPVQVCVDWFFCPSGWDTEKFLRPKFFTHTLPEIASMLSTEPVQISLRQGQRPTKRRRIEASIPSGVVFIPFTRRIVAELFKVRAALEKIYQISFTDREQLLVEHPMFAATASIPDEEMETFQKRPRPEGRYAKELFDAVQANRMDGAATNVDGASLKDYVMNNCTESTRMIKLAMKR